MSKDEFPLQDIILQLSSSENELKKVNDTIINLTNKLELLKSKSSKLIEENEEYNLINKLCLKDISEYKEEIKKLNKNKKDNEKKISELKNENQNLKNKKVKKSKKEKKKPINNIKDLSKSLGFVIKNDNDEFEEKREIRKSNIEEKLQKKKIDNDLEFIKLKEKCNGFYQDIEQQKQIVENYKRYLNEISQQMNVFNEALNISSVNNNPNSNIDANKQLDEISQQIDIVSISLVELEDVYYNIKNLFGKNIENLLNEIHKNLMIIDKGEYKNESHVKNLIQSIGHKIEEIQNLIFIFEENKNNFYDKNHYVEEDINKLKYLYKKYIQIYKKNRANQCRMNNQNINENFIQSQINNNRNINNNNINYNDNIPLGESFLFSVKNQKNKADMYKTSNLFKEREEDYIENYLEESQIIRKNWHEVCYVYDDYDIYDIYYDIKAVGLENNHYFTSCSHGFYYDKIVEIYSFLINGNSSNYQKKNHSITFKIKLNNFETAKIHIKYKETKDLRKLSKGEIEERNIYRSEYYGLDKSLSGQMAKFCLILKGSFDIVNFEDYFLTRNEANLNEIEYFWGGRVPYGGKRTLIMFSKNQAIWSFCSTSQFSSNYNIQKAILKTPIEFIGGNNEILNISPSSPQTSNIILDQENRQYVARYIKTQYKRAEFIIKGELQNKCKGEWLVDLSNEEIENQIPKEDILCKSQLNQIAKKIIEDFDKNNTDNDFKYLDYMKIGIWVYKNIKYDYNYIGKTEMSSIDIYNIKHGVCHHFTKLSNALLYSLGYKVLYISGYVCKKNKEFNSDSGHAWSLIKLGNKWYPFDSTWGIFSGKLPVGHIFGTFFNKSKTLRGVDVHFTEEIIKGKYIG